jgi:transcriptional regulator with XRE-family HTH domain
VVILRLFARWHRFSRGLISGGLSAAADGRSAARQPQSFRWSSAILPGSVYLWEQLTVLAREELAYGLHSRLGDHAPKGVREACTWNTQALSTAGGARVAELRKARGITQAALARRAGILVSLLSKIEIGDRTLTPGIAAAIAQTLQISLGALYGEAEVSADQSMLLEDLRTAVRRYDIPDQAPVPDPAQLHLDLDHAITTPAM